MGERALGRSGFLIKLQLLLHPDPEPEKNEKNGAQEKEQRQWVVMIENHAAQHNAHRKEPQSNPADYRFGRSPLPHVLRYRRS